MIITMMSMRLVMMMRLMRMVKYYRLHAASNSSSFFRSLTRLVRTPLPAMVPPPWFDFTRYKYWAEVRRPFTCRVYAAPLNAEGIGGNFLGVRYPPGTRIELAEEVHQTLEYVAVRITDGGWINVWCARNNQGRLSGVPFCTIHWERK